MVPVNRWDFSEFMIANIGDDFITFWYKNKRYKRKYYFVNSRPYDYIFRFKNKIYYVNQGEVLKRW